MESPLSVSRWAHPQQRVSCYVTILCRPSRNSVATDQYGLDVFGGAASGGHIYRWEGCRAREQYPWGQLAWRCLLCRALQGGGTWLVSWVGWSGTATHGGLTVLFSRGFVGCTLLVGLTARGITCALWGHAAGVYSWPVGMVEAPRCALVVPGARCAV